MFGSVMPRLPLASVLLVACMLLFSVTVILKDASSASGPRRLGTQSMPEQASGEDMSWQLSFAEWLAASKVDVSPKIGPASVAKDPTNVTQWAALSSAWIERYAAADHHASFIHRDGNACLGGKLSHVETTPAVRGAKEESQEPVLLSNSITDVSNASAFKALAAVVTDEREGSAIAKSLEQFEDLAESCTKSTNVECPSISREDRCIVHDAWWLAMFGEWLQERTSEEGDGEVSSLGRWKKGYKKKWGSRRRRRHGGGGGSGGGWR
eukprot:TRINITY_DN1246_c0_g1_i2.p1 TRINITY_DN1246_c0_g1~~TRINITY_DN1246_c0_g1_i2.p1  ORF type:complete len:267 (-),score=46.78 TRINITY_DN1246_c0_g1_i2:277-1077(-)